MKKRFGAQLAIIFLLCMSISPLRAVLLEGNAGGIKVLSSGSQYTFDNTTTGAEGFVWLRGGFLIAGETTSDITMEIVAPVMGSMTLNSKTLKLLSDLHLASNAAFVGNGTIDGGGNTITLDGDLAYTGELTIDGDTIFNGKGGRIDLTGGGGFTVSDGKTLTFKNVTLDGLDASAFTMATATSKLVFDNATINFSAGYTFTTGAIDVYGTSVIRCGPGATNLTVQFDSASNLTIQSYANLILDHGITLQHNNTVTNNIVFASESSTLTLLGATLEAEHANGLVLKKGALVFDHTSALQGNITLGATGSTDDLEIIFLPGARTKAQGSGKTLIIANDT